MGRGKVKLQRIENGVRRADCFSKRRRGLLKKASELAEFCGAEVAVVIFTAKGKVSLYSSQSSLEKTFERYRRFVDSEQIVKSAAAVQRGLEFADPHSDHGLRANQRSLNDGFSETDVNKLVMLQEKLENDLRKVRLMKIHESRNIMDHAGIKYHYSSESAALLKDSTTKHSDQVRAVERKDSNEEEEARPVAESYLAESSGAAASQPCCSRTLQLFKDF